MSRQTVSKTVTVVGRSIFALGFVLCALQSCGSSSSGDVVALCQQGCDKAVACEPDAGSIGATEAAACKSSCTTQTASTTKCTNAAAIESAAKACLAMDCSSYQACLGALPACEGGGSGGSGGTGGANGGTSGGGAGATGSGGTSGTAGCASCDKAATCCAAIAAQADASASGCDAYSTSMCNTSGQDQSLEVQACSAILSAGAALNVTACK
ncbi:MAG TPA: hypothetical protein VFG23_01015 [Polyangia bacterium]|nr:hypothetical protein [Polyangia bacterium]